MKKSIASFVFLALIFFLSGNSYSAVTFSDDFNDGNANSWTFYGSNSGYWSVNEGRLQHNRPGGYMGDVDFALINGQTTLSQFTLEADISVISSRVGSVGVMLVLFGE